MHERSHKQKYTQCLVPSIRNSGKQYTIRREEKRTGGLQRIGVRVEDTL